MLQPPPSCCRTTGDGTFTRKEIAPDLSANSASAVVLDFNKDSWMDFFLTRTNAAPLLLRNSATQRFTAVDLPLPANIVADRGAAAIDFDNDGFLDLAFIARASPTSSTYSLKLLRNRGSAGFEDVSTETTSTGSC